MNTHKQALIQALRKFVNQRPGLEYCNYENLSSYRSEQRSIARDKRDALALLSAVEYNDGISADDICIATKHAYSGRLTVRQNPSCKKEGCHFGEIPGTPYTQCPNWAGHPWDVEYCTGQYFPTEYRKAVAAVCASALWDSFRDQLPDKDPEGLIFGRTPGDYIRAHFRDTFGRSIQQRWFR